MRKVRCEDCTARKLCIIADLPDDKLDRFRTWSFPATYRSRQVIFHCGAPATGLYVLCCGAVKLYQSDRFGRDHIVAVAGPGEILGEVPTDMTEPYSVSAEAIADTQLCYLPREHLAELFNLHPMSAVRVAMLLSKALSTARRKARALALKSAEGRLADLIIQLAANANGNGSNASANGRKKTAVRLDLQYSRRELAEMIGVSTETAIRLLGRLEEKKAITIAHRELAIADPEKLARIANYEDVAA